MEAVDFVGGYYGGDFSPEKRMSSDQKATENFTVESLLDFSNEDAVIRDRFLDNVAGNSIKSSTITCNSYFSGGDKHLPSAALIHSSHFSGDLCVPENLRSSVEGEGLILFWIVIRQLAEIEEHMATQNVVDKEAEWNKKVNDVNISKEDMNKMVMDFLVIQGHVEVAENFKLEGGTEHVDLATVKERMVVIKACTRWKHKEAIQKLNEINPGYWIDILKYSSICCCNI